MCDAKYTQHLNISDDQMSRFGTTFLSGNYVAPAMADAGELVRFFFSLTLRKTAVEAPALLLTPFYIGVSGNGGAPKSSILIGFSIIHHLFWGTIIFGNTHMRSAHFFICHRCT